MIGFWVLRARAKAESKLRSQVMAFAVGAVRGACGVAGACGPGVSGAGVGASATCDSAASLPDPTLREQPAIETASATAQHGSTLLEKKKRFIVEFD